ncbi:hypothetical protein NA57DRAFT_75411 [Rhizodiscina lignyota]|uniref:Dpy-30 domain-containing protein n=1 Tax=Rhizodiscina lignyota TaxID=1504668 RepID=A0A9P4IIH1_9PEZI|nr:hypothetical protein NA57DRAFT_75411 [Rhizodiscina lignyota]
MADSTPMDHTDTNTPASVANGTDVTMKEEPTPDNAAVPTPIQAQHTVTAPSASPAPFTSIATPSLQPQAVATPTSTPMAPARSSPHPGATTQTATPAPPSQPNLHGSPTRVYLNQNVTPHLLEAMKYLAVNEPEKPLKWLADFLAQRSAEVEGV